MRKVMTLVGTRPELIKMSRVIAELDANTRHVLVHSGQNYDFELNEVFFGDLGIRRPNYFLEAAGATAAKTISEVIARTDEVLAQERPEALLLYGDTNTCLAVIAAKRRKVPVFHMEAGNRCFDERVPEELNRKLVDHLSDINLVLSEHARRYLIAEGIRPETIIKTGSHLPEVLAHAMPRIQASDVLTRTGLEPGRFFIVSAHREETVDTPERLRTLLGTLRAVVAEWKMPIIFSTHPRTRKRLEELGESVEDPMIRFLAPFGFNDYVRLQLESFCVLSDSGSITEEASLLNLPAVTIRDTHERPEGMDVGTVVMCGLRRDHVLDAIRVVTGQHDRTRRVFPVVPDYEARPVSKQVVRVVLSYIDYVNRTVWRRGYD
jgi:UDP-N-acetylglucosamine 2-epimerase (non-hydrolysing)